MNGNNKYALILEKVSLIVKQSSLILNRPIQSISEVSNPSTNIDVDISKFLSKALSELHKVDVLSEEDLISKSSIQSTCWIIDPIDGTINFICGSPDFAISVALVDKNYDPIISVVFYPSFDQLYTAHKGHGAKLNGKKILRTHSEQQVISYGLPKDSDKRYEMISADIKKLIKNGYVLRQSGSAAIDVCRVASGIWQSFFEKGLYIWDVVAADLIAREAGCISQINLLNDRYECNYIVSSSSPLQKNLLNQLKWD